MKTHNSRMSKPTQRVNFILKLLNLLKEIVVYPLLYKKALESAFLLIILAGLLYNSTVQQSDVRIRPS